MSYRLLIHNANIVNEGRIFVGSLLIENDQIAEILEGRDQQPSKPPFETIDAEGCFLLPGIIDGHVHFRDPGLCHKADFECESFAAAAGGVTTILDMPNTLPATTTREALRIKEEIAAKKSHVNYGFFLGATANNIQQLRDISSRRIAGIKLFLGSSTGELHVEERSALESIFETAPKLIVVHCEDNAIISHNMQTAKNVWGIDPPIACHSQIRSKEACINSTRFAISLAEQFDKQLHVAHISCEEELRLLEKANNKITAEVCLPHLLFCEDDYKQLGSRIKCNPSVKSRTDRETLRRALSTDKVYTIATDHAPHTVKEKIGGAARALSGMPMIQFSLPAMLELHDKGYLGMERLVELMCHNPARLYQIENRGFLRIGYKADLTLVRPHAHWTLTPNKIRSKCNWSPLEGHTFHWQVEKTFCNGALVYNNGHLVSETKHGLPVTYNR